MTGQNEFMVGIVLETRSLNVRGDLAVSAVGSIGAPHGGKVHNSGWWHVKTGLEKLGFRLVSDGSLNSTAAIKPSEPAVDGDSVSVHVADATRADLIQTLTDMPEESFGWFVGWASGLMMQYPDGLGGFRQDSRDAIGALRKAAAAYVGQQ